MPESFAMPPRRPERPSRDPFAVALANASLLGVGYAMLGRRVLATLAASVSVALLIVLASVERAGWLQYVVFAWWATTVAHGCYLAARARTRPVGVRGQRLVAAAFAVPVLATFVLVRVDAGRIESDADEAHVAGECARVQSIVDDLGPAHRLADAPLVDRANDGAEACRLVERARRQAEDDRLAAARTMTSYTDHRGARWPGAAGYRADLLLDQADDDLRTALTGDVDALGDGFDLLPRIRGEFPGRTSDTDRVLDDFLGGLPVEDPCVTVRITDWIDSTQSRGGLDLNRAGETVPEVAPAALVGCGDRLMTANNATEARKKYQQLSTEYPDHTLEARARNGVATATRVIQLRDVRALLATPPGGGLPAYCDHPAPYSGARPHRGGGPHRTLLYGQDFQRNSLPARWRATDAANAVLVMCAGESVHGAGVATCPYEGPINGFPVNVTFHKRKIPVRVYEVRTGRLVANTAVQIGGASCPAVLRYEYHVADLGPPSDVYVAASREDIRAAYRPLIAP